MDMNYQLFDVEQVGKSFEQVGKTIAECFNNIAKVFHNILEIIKKSFPTISEISSKNISRKRFIKLLMSDGIQRNQANKIANKYHKKQGEYKFIDVLTEWRNHNEQ